MARAISRKKKGPVAAKKVSHDGIDFASGLEKYMYIALKKADIRAYYEHQTYELVSGFDFNISSYERQGNGKGEFINRGNKKILNIKYTPDFFVYDKNGYTEFIIECKGRANEAFPLRWKLFKKLMLEVSPNVVLFKPQNHKECDMVINLILNLRK